MKRRIISAAILAAAATLAGCQDLASPPSEALGPADASPAPAPEASASAQDITLASTTAKQLWAVVRIDGTLAHGSRVTSTTHLGTGQYEVTFNKNVAGCSYVATSVNAHTQALGIFSAGGHLSPNGVYVETKNQGGGLTDGPFHLLVACGPLGTRFAVVGYSANLVRATPGTSLTALGAGRYRVRFAGSVSGCAYLATVGDPGSALVFSPSGVYTGSGPDQNTVYLETKNPGGGLQDGVPFHLALICGGTSNARFAVVKAGGATKRASVGTTSSRPTTGTYAITNNLTIGSCAVIATRGSVDTAVPFSPATVEILPGQTGKSYALQVRQLLFFGGAVSNQAIHAAAIC
jgi:hypothetical protein